MSECCDECKGLKAHREMVMEQIREVVAHINLRPGSADCDVNPLTANGPAHTTAVQALLAAYDAVGKFFDSVGATGEVPSA